MELPIGESRYSLASSTVIKYEHVCQQVVPLNSVCRRSCRQLVQWDEAEKTGNIRWGRGGYKGTVSGGTTFVRAGVQYRRVQQ